VRAGGETVHAVVGKFRFLNELIKLVSPKVGSSTPMLNCQIRNVLRFSLILVCCQNEHCGGLVDEANNPI
jgi:hypothetical protein